MPQCLIADHVDVYLCHAFQPATSGLSTMSNRHGVNYFNDCQVIDYGKYFKVVEHSTLQLSHYDLIPWSNIACIEKRIDQHKPNK